MDTTEPTVIEQQPARVFAVHLYKQGQSWVFDDEEKNIKGEALVRGIDNMVTELAKRQGIKHAGVGMILRFSSDPFPQQLIRLEYLCPDNFDPAEREGAEIGDAPKFFYKNEKAFGGNWYYCKELDIQGWLCPVLYRYYAEAPQNIYASLGQLPHTKQKRVKHFFRQLAGMGRW